MTRAAPTRPVFVSGSLKKILPVTSDNTSGSDSENALPTVTGRKRRSQIFTASTAKNSP